MIGGLLCILQEEHGAHPTKLIPLLYKRLLAVRMGSVDFAIFIRTSAFECRLWRSLRRI